MYKITLMVEDNEKDLISGLLDALEVGLVSLGHKIPRITTEYVHEEPTK